MELLQLKYFYESAIHESFAKTADIYMVPATSVSASVKRLEQELGCSLFDRRANRIFLNKNGMRLKSALSTAFREINSAVEDISCCDDAREIKILVRAVRKDITGYIIEYNNKHPQTVFRTVFDFSETDYKKYDVVIDRENGICCDYAYFKLCDLRLRMKTAKKNTSILNSKNLSELSDAPFISWDENSNMHRVLLNACQKAGFAPNIVAISNDKECYERFIQAGAGIGIGREDPLNESPYVSYIDLCDFDERYIVYCYYNSESYYGNVKGFVDFLKTKTKQQ